MATSTPIVFMLHPSIHRPILTLAWKTAWKHKRLWLLGVLAGLANTGSVLDVAFRAFHRLSPSLNLESLLENSAPLAKSTLLYVQKLALVSPTRINVTVTVILLGAALLALLALCGQAGLIKAIPLVDKGRKPLGLTDHTLRLIGHLLALAVISRLLMLALTLATGALMNLLATHTVAGDALVNFGLLLLFVPAALLIGYLSVFGAIEVAAKGQGALAAIAESWRVLVKHWLPLSELAITLFMINLLITTAAIGSILAFAVPYLLSLKVATLSGSGFLWLTTIGLGTILMILLGLLIFGFMTTFFYAAWYHAYEKFGRRANVVSKLERFFHHFIPAKS